MNYFRYLGTIGAFILFIVSIRFFNDGNMYWWLFMFAFIIVSGFLIGEDDTNDDTIDSMMRCFLRHKSGDSDAHCMDCGYVNKACVCKPVSNNWKVKQTDNDFIVITEEDKELPKDWEEYKATYDDSGHDDYVIHAMINRDAEIKYKTDETNEEEIPF